MMDVIRLNPAGSTCSLSDSTSIHGPLSLGHLPAEGGHVTHFCSMELSRLLLDGLLEIFKS